MKQKLWKENEELPLVLDVNDLQKILKISPPTLNFLMDQPSFGAFKVGRCKVLPSTPLLNGCILNQQIEGIKILKSIDYFKKQFSFEK